MKKAQLKEIQSLIDNGNFTKKEKLQLKSFPLYLGHDNEVGKFFMKITGTIVNPHL